VFDHVTLRVADFAASKRFYSTVLAPLGFTLDHEDPEEWFAEWGDFSIAADGKPLTHGAHVAFHASENAKVDAFWRAGTEAGYADNGPPGERPEYHGGYYAAYLLDPDGNNVEAVCHNR
jgi:catechol 2,3-dioxygenase-like lactoylglutathione lyase family enzyme